MAFVSVRYVQGIDFLWTHTILEIEFASWGSLVVLIRLVRLQACCTEYVFFDLCLMDISPQQPFQVGLLPRHNEEQIRFAWQVFKATGKGSWDDARGFKRTFSRDVKIAFVGVW
jgi:hypothetical protein